MTRPALVLERHNTALEILLHKNLITQQDYEQALQTLIVLAYPLKK